MSQDANREDGSPSSHEGAGPDFEAADGASYQSSPSGGPQASGAPVSPYGEPVGTPRGQMSPLPTAPSPTAQPTPNRPDTPPIHGQYYAQQQQFDPYQAQPYQAQGQPYGPGYAPYGRAPAPEHPQATTVLVLGILGFMVGVTGFVGWYMGAKAKKEIDRGAPYRWDGSLKVGYILSIVSSALVILVAAIYLFILIAFFAVFATM
jgi:hypothetical protein